MGRSTLPLPLPMLFTLASGLITLVLSLGAAAFWLALLPRSVCPSCGGATQAVTLGRLGRPLERLVRRRWCPSCRWTGFGRNGPVLWERKGPVAHDSGFRWGATDLPPDMGFRWGSAEEEEEGRDPAPSGARTLPATPPPPPSHPSGFRWARNGSAPEMIQARGPGGQVRRLVPLRHAERTVGFRWGGRGER